MTDETNMPDVLIPDTYIDSNGRTSVAYGYSKYIKASKVKADSEAMELAFNTSLADIRSEGISKQQALILIKQREAEIKAKLIEAVRDMFCFKIENELAVLRDDAFKLIEDIL